MLKAGRGSSRTHANHRKEGDNYCDPSLSHGVLPFSCDLVAVPSSTAMTATAPITINSRTRIKRLRNPSPGSSGDCAGVSSMCRFRARRRGISQEILGITHRHRYRPGRVIP